MHWDTPLNHCIQVSHCPMCIKASWHEFSWPSSCMQAESRFSIYFLDFSFGKIPYASDNISNPQKHLLKNILWEMNNAYFTGN